MGLQIRSWGESATHGNSHGGEESAAPSGGLSEVRLDLSGSVRPWRDWALGIAVPFQVRELRASTAPRRALGLGDIDLSARHVAWSCERNGVAHALKLLAGVELPTAPAQHATEGKSLNLDLQLGSGSFDPRLAIAHLLRSGDWTLSSTLGVRVPSEGFDDYRMGPSTRGAFAVQYQPFERFGFRAGLEGRVHAQDVHRSVPIHASEGAIVSAELGFLLRPWSKATIQLQAFIPFWASGSRAAELPVLVAGFSHDLQ